MATPAISDTFFRWRAGDPRALEVLAPMLYDEMRALSAAYLRRERPGHTLQATELAHEAFIRLLNQREVTWQNRAHFFGVSAQLMRRILVDVARRRRRLKEGDEPMHLSLEEAATICSKEDARLMALDDALDALAKIDSRKGQIVELRYFAGLNVNETAEILKIAPITVMRDWKIAKAWLYRELRRK